MAAKKPKNIKLSAELESAFEGLVTKSVASAGSVTEDDIQIATRDIDVDADELSDLYDALRARGVEITTAGEADMPDIAGAMPGVDDFDDVLVGDDDDDASPFDDDEDRESSPDYDDARTADEVLRSAPKDRKSVV